MPTIDTSRWASVERMPASHMFNTWLSKRTKHRPSNTRTKEMFKVFDRMFDGLQILPNRTKYDQSPSNTIKQHQTRCPNGKMFGSKSWHQTMFDGVWSPNIFRLSRVLRLNQDSKRFVIFRIIEVSVRVISLNLPLRLIVPTSTSIILNITKTLQCLIQWLFNIIFL